MRPNRSITVSLSEDMIELVEKKVASGEFANESEVVAEGLRHLADDDVDRGCGADADGDEIPGSVLRHSEI